MDEFNNNIKREISEIIYALKEGFDCFDNMSELLDEVQLNNNIEFTISELDKHKEHIIIFNLNGNKIIFPFRFYHP
jgi:hypothetical protein